MRPLAEVVALTDCAMFAKQVWQLTYCRCMLASDDNDPRIERRPDQPNNNGNKEYSIRSKRAQPLVNRYMRIESYKQI